MMNEEIDENNLQAPAVVQVANHEDQKLYKEDFDESESAKEYVIDQIFRGENLTIYALFEISDSVSEKHLIEVKESSTNEEFKFYHRSSYKKSNDDSNGFKSNCKNFSSNDIDRLSSKDKSQSFYCLKNNGGQIEVTREVDENRDLKVLFSKNESVEKLRFASKGVNTDIAQCPKLVDDIQKAISIGKPFTKGDGKTIEIQVFPPDKSSYELIEMETAPSVSSCGSEEFSRDYRKSSPNILLVPLLMMNEDLRNALKIKDKNQHNKEKKFSSSEKVSLGINTDFSCSEFLGRSTVSDRDQESNIEQTQTKNPNSPRGTVEKCKEFKSNEMKEETYEPDTHLDFNSKKNIIKEIKNLQDKLNNLIKSLECSESKKFSGEKSPSGINIAKQSSQPSVQGIDSKTDSKSVRRRYDDLPIFSPVTFNTKPSSLKVRKKPSTPERENPIPIHPNSTVSILTTSVSGIFESFESPWNENKGKDNLVGELSKKQSHGRNVSSNNKILPVSKSECSLQLFRIFSPDSKCAFVVELRKTLSYELGEDKTDGAKKMKCASFKSEGNFKSKNNVRVQSNVDNVLPTNITPLHCEMGDEIGKKQKQDVLLVEQKITENEELLKVLEKDVSLPVLKKPSQKDEEGDAKISYETPPLSIPSSTFPPKNEKVVVNYSNGNGDKTLKKEKSFKRITGQSRIKSGMSIDVETKVSGQMVKPTTPNKNDKKFNTESNARKDSKNSNLSKSKIPDKINRNVKKEIPQPEPPKPRSLTCNRPKSSGQSKLRKAPASANEIVSNKTHAKSERDEKLSGKYDQLHLPKVIPHKRERREISQPQSENKEREETVSNQNETCDSIQNRTICPYYSHPTSQIKRDERYFQKHDFEEKMVPKNKPQNTSSLSESSSVEGASANPTSVVVELFSKKQNSIADSHTEFDQDFTTGPDTDTSHVGLDDKYLITDAEDTDGALETGVKSVWALTKVLLYGDGTKKFEVLEVSLTPPERSLNSEKLQDLKNG